VPKLTDKRFMNICELADYLEVSKNTLYSWVWQRKIPYTKIGHLLRFDKKKIECWLEENSTCDHEY